MKSRTALRYKTLVVGAIVLGLSGVGIGASGAVTSTPTITVTPHTGLADRQIVTVTGTGFDSNAFLGTFECATGAADLSGCDFSTLDIDPADTSGALSVERPVRRLIAPAGPTIDCAVPNACELAVSDAANVLASAPLTFDPKIPPILPVVKVKPATGLRDHQLVTVSGTGFDPDSFTDVSECLASDLTTCAFETDRQFSTTDAGTFSTTTFAVERIFDSFDAEGNEHLVDCAKPATKCVLATGAGEFGGGGVPSVAPITFNPAIPPVTAKVVVHSSTGLHDLQDVTVTGSGFLPGATVSVQQCTADFGPCGTFPTSVTAGFTGGFIHTYSVRRLLPTFTFLGFRLADCTSKRTPCSIFATDNSERGIASASLGFSTTSPAVASTITASPRTHLHDDQKVAVTFKGFSAYQPITVIECTYKALADGDSSFCDPNTEMTTITPAVGNTPTLTFFAKRTLGIADGLIDCATAATRCVLLATTSGPVNGGGEFVTSSESGAAAAARHPGMSAGAAIPRTLTKPTLKALAKTPSLPGVASATISFGG